MADGLDLDSTEVRHGVLASLLDSTYRTARIPFKDHVIPGTINAVDYDLGNQFITYFDSDVSATTGSPGGGNNGTKYRNDGVDIEPSIDPQGFEYNVGWTETLEWLTYTATVEQSGTYDVEVRVASDVGGGSFQLLIDDVQIGSNLVVNDTGGWQSWVSVWLHDIELEAGVHILKMAVRAGSFNINTITFSEASTVGVEQSGLPDAFQIASVFPNPAYDEVNVNFITGKPTRVRSEMYDMVGRRVAATGWRSFGVGDQRISFSPGVGAGMYMIRLTVDDGSQLQQFERTVTVLN